MFVPAGRIIKCANAAMPRFAARERALWFLFKPGVSTAIYPRGSMSMLHAFCPPRHAIAVLLRTVVGIIEDRIEPHSSFY